jgi:hypothetical protein
LSRTKLTEESAVGEHKLPFENEVGSHPTLIEMQNCVLHQRKRPAVLREWREHKVSLIFFHPFSSSQNFLHLQCKLSEPSLAKPTFSVDFLLINSEVAFKEKFIQFPNFSKFFIGL